MIFEGVVCNIGTNTIVIDCKQTHGKLYIRNKPVYTGLNVGDQIIMDATIYNSRIFMRDFSIREITRADVTTIRKAG